MIFSSELAVFGVMLIFGFFLYLGLRSNRETQKNRQQISKNLGFFPVEPSQDLTRKIARPYHRPGAQNKYQLQNVSRRVIPDGELYLFDLVETSSDEDSYSETQAIAVISPNLKLPHIVFFPKSDQKYALSGLANRVLEWGLSKTGTPVTFPEFPALTARYVITSMDDPALVRTFLDENLAQFFSQTQMYMLHGMGDVFTFSEMDPQFRKLDQESMARRVNRGLEIFRVLQK